MELTLSEDQELFGETTRRFLGARSPIAAVREFRYSPDGFERGSWREGAELGWTSLLVPEELGGGSVSGAGLLDLTIVADAFGRHVAPGPLLPVNVVAAAVARAGSEAQQREVLPGLLDGSTIAAWCVGAPTADGGIATGVSARAAAGGFVLDGVQEPVEAAAQADLLLVTARTDAGLAQFLVAPDARGVAIAPLESLDLTRRFARVELAGVQVPAAAAVGVVGAADADVERQLELALVIQAAESVGAAETVLDFTLEWAFDRYSFGRPLASYQEIKHRFADMKTWLEAGHAIAAAAARAVQHDAADAPEVVSVAAAYIGDYVVELVQDCVQMHGGIGVTYDHDIHLYLRRVTVNRVLHGTPADHRQRITTLQERAA
ncbi:MAG: acyl-CoA dehydrogenase family protein [Acidimicrobiia bacterium]